MKRKREIEDRERLLHLPFFFCFSPFIGVAGSSLLLEDADILLAFFLRELGLPVAAVRSLLVSVPESEKSRC